MRFCRYVPGVSLARIFSQLIEQMLFHVNEFRKNVYSIPFAEEVFNESTTLAMQSVFCQLQLSSNAVTTTDLTRAFGWDSFEAFQQQDVQVGMGWLLFLSYHVCINCSSQEMLRVLLDKLEERMKDTPVTGVVKRLFAGKVRSYIRCLNIPYESTREEEFYDIQVCWGLIFVLLSIHVGFFAFAVCSWM
jgi:ubiquitin carboxyl-terminal hydrolase 7